MRTLPALKVISCSDLSDISTNSGLCGYPLITICSDSLGSDRIVHFGGMEVGGWNDVGQIASGSCGESGHIRRTMAECSIAQ